MAIPNIHNYGILASIAWNSNKWAADPTYEDLKASKYHYVKDHGHMHESLNFGHEIYPVEHDGYYIGYTPMFNRPPGIENSNNVSIVFFVSSDYKNSNQKAVIGFYGFPIFGEWYKRTATHPLYKNYNNGNIKAFPEDIIYFKNPIIINNDNVQKENLLPPGKKISQQGFNYLNSDNVYNFISLALKLNPKNEKLNSFVISYPLLIEVTSEENELEYFYQLAKKCSPDTLSGINELESKMRNQQPEVKHRISTYIERGAIASKVKKLTGYKCLVCEALGLPPHSFFKCNGDYYIETHHVEPVSIPKKGVLSVSNLMTVCANHHRQLHYGNSEIVGQSDKYFTIKLDEQVIQVAKITIN
jgi:5-methylcytosine-specific restriction protein A